jgi:hypothetical protein
MTFKFAAACCAGALLCLVSPPGHAQVGVGPTLDPAFCNQKTFRETVVYIDDMSLIDGKTDWAQKLSTKLAGSLTPGEQVSLVQLSPASGEAKAVWSGCWPDYTAEQRAEISKQNYVFSKNPLDGLKEQQSLFQGYFAQSLTKIYTDGKRAAGQVRFVPENAPKKQILRSIASDDGRYSASQKTIRAIVYSDMMENSDLGSVYDPLPDKFPNYGERLGSRLRRSVFYAFGVAGDVDGAGSLPEKARAFWSRAFEMMSATTGGFGSDLVVENRVPVSGVQFDLRTTMGDEKLEGKMSILVDRDGSLVDSWIGFDRLSIVSLTGKFKCEADACALDGATTKGLVTKNDSDAVALAGRSTDLSGQIGVKSTKQLFDLKATAPRT